MSTTSQLYPFCIYIDPMALMIVDACFCQVPGQVALENRDKYEATFQKGY